jgi:hypothetical protein
VNAVGALHHALSVYVPPLAAGKTVINCHQLMRTKAACGMLTGRIRLMDLFLALCLNFEKLVLWHPPPRMTGGSGRKRLATSHLLVSLDKLGVPGWKE